MEHHAFLDLSAPDDLEEIARRDQGAVDRAQLEEAVGDAFGEAHRNRGRRKRARLQQHGRENEQAERRRPHQRHNGRALGSFIVGKHGDARGVNGIFPPILQAVGLEL